MEDTARLTTAATYNAAADHFDDAPLAFWDRHGQRTVDLLRLSLGSHVLDVGCGTGASALPAAAAVGRQGRVIGIDIAENMLKRARAKARLGRLGNISFALKDMSDSGFPDDAFDAVISVFSVFFVQDMERQVAELWRMVRPGGQLAVTVWGPGAFEPGASILGQELRRQRPDITLSARPWERLAEAESLRRLFRDGGTCAPVIQVSEDSQPLSHPSQWWIIAMGSGYRGQINQLTPEQQKTVRSQTVQRLAGMGTEAVETSAVHAIARKPR
ncbi:MAG: class I SAM-dependent methyltransferase [Hyphomicrobiales bacterium]